MLTDPPTSFKIVRKHSEPVLLALFILQGLVIYLDRLGPKNRCYKHLIHPAVFEYPVTQTFTKEGRALPPIILSDLNVRRFALNLLGARRRTLLHAPLLPQRVRDRLDHRSRSPGGTQSLGTGFSVWPN